MFKQLLIGLFLTSGLAVAVTQIDTAGIKDAAITNAKMANMAAATFKGRAAGAGTGVPVDLTATQAKTALAMSCANLTNAAASCATDATDMGNASAGTLSRSRGGTGQTSYTDGQLLIGNTSTGGLSKATITAGSNITVTNGNGTIQITATASGTGNLNAKFVLEGATVPFTSINGPHYQVATQSLTAVNISMLNSGSSGSTVVQVNQYRSGALQGSATASLSASSGNPAGGAQSLSGTLSLLAGDILTVDVNSVAGGNPSELSVEY